MQVLGVVIYLFFLQKSGLNQALRVVVHWWKFRCEDTEELRDSETQIISLLWFPCLVLLCPERMQQGRGWRRAFPWVANSSAGASALCVSATWFAYFRAAGQAHQISRAGFPQRHRLQEGPAGWACSWPWARAEAWEHWGSLEVPPSYLPEVWKVLS
jgi:hypothetical protein